MSPTLQQSSTLAVAPVNPNAVPLTALTMALLGDSITNQNSVNDYLVTDPGDPLYPYNATYNSGLWRYTSGQGFWTWANAYLGSRFTQVRPLSGPNNEFGMSGKTALDLITEGHVDRVIAANPSWCHVLIGRNDVFNGAISSEVSIRVKAVVDKLVAAGIKVVLSTILPGSTGTTLQHQTIRAANAFIKAWAVNKRGVVLNDWYNTLVDASTGNGKSVYFADGTHPYGAGASRLGYALAQVLDPITPKSTLQVGTDGLLGLSALQAGTAGVFSGANPGGGSGSLATNSTCYVASGVTVVASKVARTDLYPGEWQQLQQTAGTGAYNYTQRNSNVGVDWNIGDTVYGVVEYQTDAASWAANQLFVTLHGLPNDQRVDAAGNTSDTTLYQPVVSQGVLRTPLMTVGAGATYLRLDVTCGGGTHTARFGRMQIYKV